MNNDFINTQSVYKLNRFTYSTIVNFIDTVLLLSKKYENSSGDFPDLILESINDKIIKIDDILFIGEQISQNNFNINYDGYNKIFSRIFTERFFNTFCYCKDFQTMEFYIRKYFTFIDWETINELIAKSIKVKTQMPIIYLLMRFYGMYINTSSIINHIRNVLNECIEQDIRTIYLDRNIAYYNNKQILNSVTGFVINIEKTRNYIITIVGK